MEASDQSFSLPELRTRVLGRQLAYLDTVDSTNLEARRRLSAGPAEGHVIIAAQQTAGRGRRGRHWVSERASGLWLTAVLRLGIPTEELQKLTLTTAAAVCRALECCTEHRLVPLIKWPNDILAQGRKLCGILCESVHTQDGSLYTIVGIGINIRQPVAGWGEAADVAVSIEEASGEAVTAERLAASVLNNLEELTDDWQSEGFGPIAALYRQRMLPAGTDVLLGDGQSTRQGRIEGLDDGGGLLVRLQGGQLQRVISGEISVRGVSSYV